MENIFENWPPREKALNYTFVPEEELLMEIPLIDNEIKMGKEEVDQGR